MTGTGEALALVSGFSFAAASVAVAKGSRQAGGDNGALLSVIVTALAAATVWMTLAEDPLRPFAGKDWLPGIAWFALSGMLTIVLGRALLFRSVESLGAVRASAVKRLNPFFSVVLATLVLGESITAPEVLGMSLIAVSFALLIRESLDRSPGFVSRAPQSRAQAYAYGPASALCYAVGYIARKWGLLYLPEPSFGTLVGAVAGLTTYFVAAALSRSFRRLLGGVFTNSTRWQWMAGIFVSIGQLSQFAAIHYIEISRVVMIASLEVFFAMLLSVYVLRTEMRPSLMTIIGSCTAVAGTLVIALS